jgi:hypothetical protein
LGYDYENTEYKDLMQKFKDLMELHDNQKKLLARLQARNLELEQELDHLKGLPLATNMHDEDEDEDEGIFSDSKYY